MAFPDAPRVIYEKTPSEEVICQLRFPAVLKIESEPPSAFQELIRAEFPFYELRPAMRFMEAMPAEFAGMLAPLSGQTAHQFSSVDKRWTIALTREFLALTCHPYDRWEMFRARLSTALSALVGVYAPAFFTRVGLRYRDVIRRSVLGLSGVDWVELLTTPVAGAYSSKEVAPDIEHSARELLIRLPDEGHVRVHHGTVQDVQTKETVYVFDSDFYTEQQMDLAHVLERLDSFNRQARLFFRWCIQERLHDAMGPTLVPNP